MQLKKKGDIPLLRPCQKRNITGDEGDDGGGGWRTGGEFHTEEGTGLEGVGEKDGR